jgi:hypothetical protein
MTANPGLRAIRLHAMIIRVKNIGPYEYLYLVENDREGGRHLQRVIKELGRRDEIENVDMLDGRIPSAARHARRSIVLCGEG